MTSRQLLFRRIRENWHFQYSVLKSVVDWTVLVYLVLPAVGISFFIYRSWWIEAPGWIESVPFGLFFSICFFLLWGSTFQTYIREADNVFLRKQERLMLRMKQGGIVLSSMTAILSGGFLSALIAPFWMLHYGYTGTDLALFLSLWVSLKWMIMGINSRMNVQLSGWRSFIRGIPVAAFAACIWWGSYHAFLSGSLISMFSIVLFNTLVSMLFVRKRFTSIHTFEQDLSIDQKVKYKYTEFIFGLSMDMEKLPKPKPVRRSPRLYSRSNRIFSRRTEKNAFLELFIKVTVRDTQYIRGYLQILGVTSAAIVFIPPFWLKLTIVISGYFFLMIWIGIVWYRVAGSHPFTKKYTENYGYAKAKRLVTIILSIPYIFISGAYIVMFQSLSLFLAG
ncbi:ABC transporter permease [Siminovitchia sediminis]|uniref:ABC transporter permease n=1 Tax=Siminovitchia sediminis TaxID=1274353 RepID=A0ABW4KGF9_9BACI